MIEYTCNCCNEMVDALNTCCVHKSGSSVVVDKLFKWTSSKECNKIEKTSQWCIIFFNWSRYVEYDNFWGKRSAEKVRRATVRRRTIRARRGFDTRGCSLHAPNIKYYMDLNFFFSSTTTEIVKKVRPRRIKKHIKQYFGYRNYYLY